MLRSSRVSYIDMLNEEIELVVKKIIKLSVKKKEYKVYFGWYYFDEGKKMYVYVRVKVGGGKRIVMFNRLLIK